MASSASRTRKSRSPRPSSAAAVARPVTPAPMMSVRTLSIARQRSRCYFRARLMTPEAFQQITGRIRDQMAKVVVGQEDLVFGLLVTAIAGGHVLIEGAPGLGKTLVARAFARVSGTTFKRIQFTPDLM